jgi:hypothetical protein
MWRERERKQEKDCKRTTERVAPGRERKTYMDGPLIVGS